MTQFGVTECGELQDPATRNLFSACGQADLPADTFGQLPLFSPFPTAGAWRRRAGTGHGPIRGHRSRSASTICLHASATAFKVDV